MLTTAITLCLAGNSNLALSVSQRGIIGWSVTNEILSYMTVGCRRCIDIRNIIVIRAKPWGGSGSPDRMLHSQIELLLDFLDVSVIRVLTFVIALREYFAKI